MTDKTIWPDCRQAMEELRKTAQERDTLSAKVKELEKEIDWLRSELTTAYAKGVEDMLTENKSLRDALGEIAGNGLVDDASGCYIGDLAHWYRSLAQNLRTLANKALNNTQPDKPDSDICSKCDGTEKDFIISEGRKKFIDTPCQECGGSGIKKQKDFKVRMIPVDGDVITGSVKTNVPCLKCEKEGD